jgi:hypothetical protein
LLDLILADHSVFAPNFQFIASSLFAQPSPQGSPPSPVVEKAYFAGIVWELSGGSACFDRTAKRFRVIATKFERFGQEPE